MAAGREGGLKIHLVHGARNHFVTLAPPPEEQGGPLSVRHLIAAAQEQTGIPPDRMKLIYKGKSLTQSGDLNQSLSSFGLRNGSKVMVLGSKAVEDHNDVRAVAPTRGQTQQADDPSQVDLKRLEGVERKLCEEETTLSTLLQQGQQLKSQWVKDPAQLEQVKKGLQVSAERLMRLLESLDMLRFDPSDTDARSRRKALVNQIQQHMDRCEEVLGHVKGLLLANKK